MNWKLQAALTVAVALALALLGVGLLWVTLSPEQAAQVGALLKGVWPVALLALLPLVGLSVWFWRGHDHQHAQGPDRLMEKVKLLSAAAQSQQIDVRAESPALQRLGQAIHALAAERDRWRDDVQTQVAEASQSIQQERNRLAALMSELTQDTAIGSGAEASGAGPGAEPGAEDSAQSRGWLNLRGIFGGGGAAGGSQVENSGTSAPTERDSEDSEHTKNPINATA